MDPSLILPLVRLKSKNFFEKYEFNLFLFSFAFLFQLSDLLDQVSCVKGGIRARNAALPWIPFCYLKRMFRQDEGIYFDFAANCNPLTYVHKGDISCAQNTRMCKINCSSCCRICCREAFRSCRKNSITFYKERKPSILSLRHQPLEVILH